MKLLLRHNRKAGGLMGGKLLFVLDARIELSPQERKEFDGNKQFADYVLYQRLDGQPGDCMPVPAYAALDPTYVTMTAGKALNGGQSVETRDFAQMVEIVASVREQTASLKKMLDLANAYTGEELVEL